MPMAARDATCVMQGKGHAGFRLLRADAASSCPIVTRARSPSPPRSALPEEGSRYSLRRSHTCDLSRCRNLDVMRPRCASLIPWPRLVRGSTTSFYNTRCAPSGIDRRQDLTVRDLLICDAVLCVASPVHGEVEAFVKERMGLSLTADPFFGGVSSM